MEEKNREKKEKINKKKKIWKGKTNPSVCEFAPRTNTVVCIKGNVNPREIKLVLKPCLCQAA